MQSRIHHLCLAPSHLVIALFMLALSASGANLVYSLTERGNGYGGGGGGPIIGNGYLVLDPIDGHATVLMTYANAVQRRERWDIAPALTYIVDGGLSKYQFMSNGAPEILQVAAPVDSYDYAHLFGVLTGANVHIGNEVRVRIPLRLGGLRRAGTTSGMTSYATMAIDARIDGRTTLDVNSRNLGHEDVADMLASRLSLREDPAPVALISPAEVVAADTGIALYSIALNGIHVGAGAVSRYRYPGFMLCDLATGRMLLLKAWRDGSTWYYETQDLTEGDAFNYVLPVGGSQFQFTGSRLPISTSSASSVQEEIGFNFWHAYGLRRTTRIGSSLTADVARSLVGSF